MHAKKNLYNTSCFFCIFAYSTSLCSERSFFSFCVASSQSALATISSISTTSLVRENLLPHQRWAPGGTGGTDRAGLWGSGAPKLKMDGDPYLKKIFVPGPSGDQKKGHQKKNSATMWRKRFFEPLGGPSRGVGALSFSLVSFHYNPALGTEYTSQCAGKNRRSTRYILHPLYPPFQMPTSVPHQKILWHDSISDLDCIPDRYKRVYAYYGDRKTAVGKRREPFCAKWYQARASIEQYMIRKGLQLDQFGFVLCKMSPYKFILIISLTVKRAL